MFGVQLYQNNARALLSRILSILNLDWLQRARSVRGVYELLLLECSCRGLCFVCYGSCFNLLNQPVLILFVPLQVQLTV